MLQFYYTFMLHISCKEFKIRALISSLVVGIRRQGCHQAAVSHKQSLRNVTCVCARAILTFFASISGK